jgi:hypothetical protein
MRNVGCRGRRRAGAAARADHTDNSAAIADIVVQQPQQGVGARLLAEAAPHPQLEAENRSPPRRAPRQIRSSPPRERRGTPPSAPAHADPPFDRKPTSKAMSATHGDAASRSWRPRSAVAVAPGSGGLGCGPWLHYRPRRFAFHSPSSGRRYAAKASPSRRPVQRRPNPRLRAVLAHPEHVLDRLDFWSITARQSVRRWFIGQR